MPTMEDDQGNRVEIDYDPEHDMTQWETYDSDGNQTGGGQSGGDRVDEVTNEYYDKDYHDVSDS